MPLPEPMEHGHEEEDQDKGNEEERQGAKDVAKVPCPEAELERRMRIACRAWWKTLRIFLRCAFIVMPYSSRSSGSCGAVTGRRASGGGTRVAST